MAMFQIYLTNILEMKRPVTKLSRLSRPIYKSILPGELLRGYRGGTPGDNPGTVVLIECDADAFLSVTNKTAHGVV